MKRQLLIFSVLVLLSAGLAASIQVISDPVLTDLFYTSLALTITYSIFSVIIGMVLVKRISDPKTRYTANKDPYSRLFSLSHSA